jgi:hypothetical protein
MGEPRGTVFPGDGDSVFMLEGSQALPARPSEKVSVKMKTL